jgi:lipid-binding SYLF domain-containing protein
MVVKNQGGEEKLLSDKFTLGGEGSLAARPVGRTATAQTDLQMHAEILSWSRSQGVFAGVALEGATLTGCGRKRCPVQRDFNDPRACAQGSVAACDGAEYGATRSSGPALGVVREIGIAIGAGLDPVAVLAGVP